MFREKDSILFSIYYKGLKIVEKKSVSDCNSEMGDTA